MAKRDWRREIQEAVEAFGDRLRDALEAFGEVLAPQPQLVPVPIRPNQEDRERR
jgi:hypothetical protein